MEKKKKKRKNEEEKSITQSIEVGCHMASINAAENFSL